MDFNRVFPVHIRNQPQASQTPSAGLNCHSLGSLSRGSPILMQFGFLHFGAFASCPFDTMLVPTFWLCFSVLHFGAVLVLTSLLKMLYQYGFYILEPHHWCHFACYMLGPQFLVLCRFLQFWFQFGTASVVLTHAAPLPPAAVLQALPEPYENRTWRELLEKQGPVV